MKRVVLGISGASGALLGLSVAEMLVELVGVELHLVMTDAAKRTFAHEIGPDALDRVTGLAHRSYRNDDVGAAIASGSLRTEGMIVVPCSMRSLAAIAAGLADNLLVRAADVQLKERRPLVLMARETPLHLGHLRNMMAITEMGGIIMPPAPAFYRKPSTLDDIIGHLAARAIDMLRLTDHPLAVEWRGGI